MKSYLFFYSLSTYQEWTRTGRDGRNPKKKPSGLVSMNCEWTGRTASLRPIKKRKHDSNAPLWAEAFSRPHAKVILGDGLVVSQGLHST